MAEKEVEVDKATVPLSSDSPNSVQKVIVQLKATADAPILKQNKFKILGTEKFAKVIEFLRRQLHRETVFVYINSAFSPNPDELVIDLLNISSTQARGTLFVRTMRKFLRSGRRAVCSDFNMSIATTHEFSMTRVEERPSKLDIMVQSN